MELLDQLEAENPEDQALAPKVGEHELFEPLLSGLQLVPSEAAVCYVLVQGNAEQA